jgi:hypothetical protein
MRCASCGDETNKQNGQHPPRKLSADKMLVWNSHCYECAMELLFNRVVCGPPVQRRGSYIPKDRTNRSGYMEDEASQYQENAIRDMEDRGE